MTIKTPLSSPIGTTNPTGLMDSIVRQLSEITPVPEDEHKKGIPTGWPKKVWVIEFANGTHGCMAFPAYSTKGCQTNGIAAFKLKDNAKRHLHIFKSDAMLGHKFVQVTFEDAVKIVTSKPPDITALFLADQPERPKIYQVR